MTVEFVFWSCSIIRLRNTENPNQDNECRNAMYHGVPSLVSGELFSVGSSSTLANFW
jgi:hypothetical protein